MSNKFLKILGVCVLIVLLPVLITVTAVCLVEDTNEINDANAIRYTVDCGDYAEDVKIKEKDGKWTFETMPKRAGYTLTDVKLDGKIYDVQDGVIVLTEETEVVFETAAEAEKEISAVWTCNFNSIWVGLAGSLAENDVCINQGNGYFDTTISFLENINVFTSVGYQLFDTNPITSLTVRLDSTGDGLVEDEDNATYTITFVEGDKTEGGDITLSTIIAKLEAQNATITIDTDRYTEIELSIA